MKAGIVARSRKEQKRYQKYAATRTNACDFCDFTENAEQVLAQHVHFWVVKNMFGYDIWDGMDVGEHLMVVPKRHIDSIGHFTPEESKEYLKIISDYEVEGYSFYGRAAQNVSKSVQHQHTHLIRLGSKKARALLYVRKPHYLKYF
jgi:diadenosine tetraphosphate (Ap4A) HIT family hydrolase